MAKHYPLFAEWVEPFKVRAKAADVKLSNKNIKRLRSIYTRWFTDTYQAELGYFGALFRAVYSDAIVSLIPSSHSSWFMEKVEPNPYYVPVKLTVGPPKKPSE